jgi:Sec-independent protein translocase protein TatA
MFVTEILLIAIVFIIITKPKDVPRRIENFLKFINKLKKETTKLKQVFLNEDFDFDFDKNEQRDNRKKLKHKKESKKRSLTNKSNCFFVKSQTDVTEERFMTSQKSSKNKHKTQFPSKLSKK